MALCSEFAPDPGARPARLPGIDCERMFVCVERQNELESLRRSLAMLRPGAPALDREEAMRLVRELQELERQLRTLRQGLQRLLAEGERGPAPA